MIDDTKDERSSSGKHNRDSFDKEDHLLVNTFDSKEKSPIVLKKQSTNF